MSAGAERAQMVLEAYDRDPDQRLSNLLADLAEYALAEGLDWPLVVVIAHQRAQQRRSDAAARADICAGRCDLNGPEACTGGHADRDPDALAPLDACPIHEPGDPDCRPTFGDGCLGLTVVAQ